MEVLNLLPCAVIERIYCKSVFKKRMYHFWHRYLIMSPPQLGEDILFLPCPSVHLPSHFVSGQYLENHLSQSLHISHGLYKDMIPIEFGLSRSKVKVTVLVYVKLVSIQYLENHLSQSLHISHGDRSL